MKGERSKTTLGAAYVAWMKELTPEELIRIAAIHFKLAVKKLEERR